MSQHQPAPPEQNANGSRLLRVFGFKTRLYLTWMVMLGLCIAFFMSFDLKFSIIAAKWQYLVG